jgi:hypothetical protein
LLPPLLRRPGVAPSTEADDQPHTRASEPLTPRLALPQSFSHHATERSLPCIAQAVATRTACMSHESPLTRTTPLAAFGDHRRRILWQRHSPERL